MAKIILDENEDLRNLASVLKKHGYEKIARQSAITGAHVYAHPVTGHEVAVTPHDGRWAFKSKWGHSKYSGNNHESLDAILSQGLMR